MDRLNQRKLILFGAGGRLGGAIHEAALCGGIAVETVPWADAKYWSQRHTVNIVRPFDQAGNADVVFAGGLIDPSANESDLTFANVGIPSLAIENTAHNPDVRYLTIGSVLETFTELVSNNRYLASKAMLSRHICKLAGDPRLAHRMTHLRLHTLYGGAPAPHSFLGQIVESLSRGQPFAMSEGRQLREYTNVLDVAHSILALLKRDWEINTAHALSTGKPITLRDLALAVFQKFGRADLLQIGANRVPDGENMATYFPRSPAWLLGEPKDQVAGVCEWISGLLGQEQLQAASPLKPPSS